MKEYRFETLAIHAGHQVDPSTRAISAPIYLTTTFEREADGSFPQGYVYSRSENPNRHHLEVALATLEQGTVAAAFASGSAAAAAIFRALPPKSHVIVPDDMYHGIRKLLDNLQVVHGLQLSYVDMTNLDAIEKAIQDTTQLIWIESPSNPLLKITDIHAVAELANSRGITVACDNTWTPPPMQPVFALGAHLVMHATTKYLAGHSDVTGGAVISQQDSDLFQQVRFIQQYEGAVPSPFDAWLIQRGLKSLAYRMRGHCYNAEQLATFLASHSKVEKVNYPGLSNHPQHATARKQMTNYGGMMSIQIKGGESAAMAVAAKVKLFTRATSLGGVESLIEHRASIEGEDSQTPKNLLRISVGLEHSDDLIEDMAQALS